MRLSSVSSWTAEQVSQWIGGLDDALVQYGDKLKENEISGTKLLAISRQDLDKLEVVKVGHQELLLECVELLHKLPKEEKTEESLKTLVSSFTENVRSALNKVKEAPDAREEKGPLPEGVLQALSAVTSAANGLVTLLSRWPYSVVKRCNQLREKICKKAESITKQAEKNSRLVVKELSEKLNALNEDCEEFLSGAEEKVIFQCFTVATAVLNTEGHKAGLGLAFSTGADHLHIISGIHAQSPASLSEKIDIGDEILQISEQVVVGWQQDKVAELLKSQPSSFPIMVKKLPGEQFTELPVEPTVNGIHDPKETIESHKPQTLSEHKDEQVPEQKEPVHDGGEVGAETVQNKEPTEKQADEKLDHLSPEDSNVVATEEHKEQSHEESKEDTIVITKEESKEESKEVTVEVTKEESKDETKEITVEVIKEESKEIKIEVTKEESKETVIETKEQTKEICKIETRLESEVVESVLETGKEEAVVTEDTSVPESKEEDPSVPKHKEEPAVEIGGSDETMDKEKGGEDKPAAEEQKAPSVAVVVDVKDGKEKVEESEVKEVDTKETEEPSSPVGRTKSLDEEKAAETPLSLTTWYVDNDGEPLEETEGYSTTIVGGVTHKTPINSGDSMSPKKKSKRESPEHNQGKFKLAWGSLFGKKKSKSPPTSLERTATDSKVGKEETQGTVEASPEEKEPSEPPSEAKEEKEPSESPSEAKEEKEPSEPPSEAKEEKEPSEPPSEAKEEKEPSEPLSEMKEEKEPSEPLSETKEEKEPSEPLSEMKEEKEPSEPPSETKEEAKTETVPVETVTLAAAVKVEATDSKKETIEEPAIVEKQQEVEQSPVEPEETPTLVEEDTKHSEEMTAVEAETTPKQSEEPAGQVGKAVDQAEEPDKLAEESAKPVEEPVKPAEESTKPAEEPAKPDEEPVKPAEESAKPAEEPVKSAEESTKPAEEPAEEPVKPAEESAKPAEEPVKPPEEPTKPAEEPAKPVEEPTKSAEEPTKSGEEGEPTTVEQSSADSKSPEKHEEEPHQSKFKKVWGSLFKGKRSKSVDKAHPDSKDEKEDCSDSPEAAADKAEVAEQPITTEDGSKLASAEPEVVVSTTEVSPESAPVPTSEEKVDEAATKTESVAIESPKSASTPASPLLSDGEAIPDEDSVLRERIARQKDSPVAGSHSPKAPPKMNMKISYAEKTKEGTLEVEVHGEVVRRSKDEKSKRGPAENRISCVELGEADHKGWLTKKSSGGLLAHWSWKRKWMVLKDQKLYYYKTSFDSVAGGVIPLDGAEIALATEIKKPLCFKVEHPQIKTGKMYFIADTQDELDLWFKVLNTTSKGEPIIKPSPSNIVRLDVGHDQRRRSGSTGMRPKKVGSVLGVGAANQDYHDEKAEESKERPRRASHGSKPQDTSKLARTDSQGKNREPEASLKDIIGQGSDQPVVIAEPPSSPKSEPETSEAAEKLVVQTEVQVETIAEKKEETVEEKKEVISEKEQKAEDEVPSEEKKEDTSGPMQEEALQDKDEEPALEPAVSAVEANASETTPDNTEPASPAKAEESAQPESSAAAEVTSEITPVVERTEAGAADPNTVTQSEAPAAVAETPVSEVTPSPAEPTEVKVPLKSSTVASDDVTRTELPSEEGAEEKEKEEEAVDELISQGVKRPSISSWKEKYPHLSGYVEGTEEENPQEQPQSDGADGQAPQPEKIDGQEPQPEKIDGQEPQPEKVDGQAPEADDVEGKAPQPEKVDGQAPQADDVDGQAPQQAQVTDLNTQDTHL